MSESLEKQIQNLYRRIRENNDKKIALDLDNKLYQRQIFDLEFELKKNV